MNQHKEKQMDLLTQNDWKSVAKDQKKLWRSLALFVAFGISILLILHPDRVMLCIIASILFVFFLILFLTSKASDVLFKLSDVIPSFLFPKEII